MNLLILLVVALTPLALQAEEAAQQPVLSPFIPLLIIFGIFYFLVMRPQQKKAKVHQTYLSNLKKGEMVITNAGIIGTIKLVSEKFVTLEVDRGVCLKILRSQILESADSLKDKETNKKGALTGATS